MGIDVLDFVVFIPFFVIYGGSQAAANRRISYACGR